MLGYTGKSQRRPGWNWREDALTGFYFNRDSHRLRSYLVIHRESGTNPLKEKNMVRIQNYFYRIAWYQLARLINNARALRKALPPGPFVAGALAQWEQLVSESLWPIKAVVYNLGPGGDSSAYSPTTQSAHGTALGRAGLETVSRAPPRGCRKHSLHGDV